MTPFRDLRAQLARAEAALANSRRQEEEAWLTRSRRAQSEANRLFDACMEARGWR